MNLSNLLRASIFLFLWVGLSGVIVAQSNPERETLVGLGAISVEVESIKPEIEREGLTESRLQTDVELRLRKAGIRVLDSSDPYLYVNVNVIKVSDVSFVYSINVSLDQPVILGRNKSITAIASTWHAGLTGLVGAERLQSIREDVGDLVDKFINDYLAANSPIPPTQNRSTAPSKNTPRIDFSDVAVPSTQPQQSPQDDVGVDIAYVTVLKANLRELPDSPNIVLQPVKGDLLALLDRTPRGTWYNVVHVRSGKEGWIDKSVIDIKYTRNPRPAPIFEERRVASDRDPELVIQNQTDRVLSLRLSGTLYSIPANSERSFTVPAGTYKFYGSVPNALPVLGEKSFPKGIVYTWQFYIVRGHE